MNREETTTLASSVKKVKAEDTEATRLAGDSKKTAQEQVSDKTQPEQTKELSFGRKVAKTAAGFAGGILLGGAATIGTAVLTSAADVDQDNDGSEGNGNNATVDEPVEVPGAESPTDTPEWVDEDVEISQDVNDDMSFSEAFRAAREEVGAGGAFEWRGNVYSTYTAEEWDGMSAQEKQEYNDHFDWSRYQTDVEPEPEPEPIPEPEPLPEPLPEPGDVEILGLDWDPETGVLVGEMSMDDSDVYLIDLDPDLDGGTFDVAVVDIDGDGVISEDEVLDISDQNISVEEFADMVDNNPMDEFYASDDSSDYSNDMLSI